jgi:hypothetical protein
MEQLTGKDKGKDGAAKEPSTRVDPTLGSNNGEVDSADHETKQTREEKQALAFHQLNTELCSFEDHFQADIEGKTTLEAIKAGLSKVAPYILLI